MLDPDTTPPLLIRKSDVPAKYGFSERQVKRLCDNAKLRRVKPSGVTGPVFLYLGDIEQLIAESTVPAGQKVGRKPPKAKS